MATLSMHTKTENRRSDKQLVGFFHTRIHTCTHARAHTHTHTHALAHTHTTTTTAAATPHTHAPTHTPSTPHTTYMSACTHTDTHNMQSWKQQTPFLPPIRSYWIINKHRVVYHIVDNFCKQLQQIHPPPKTTTTTTQQQQQTNKNKNVQQRAKQFILLYVLPII